MENPRRRLTRPHEWVLWVASLLSIGFGFQAGEAEQASYLRSNPFGVYQGGAGDVFLLLGVVLLVMVIFVWMYRATRPVFKAAFTPVPNPVQIAADLRVGLGREPSIEEVAAVHQMLTNQRNEALVGAGIGLGAAYLIGHNSHL